MEFLVLMKLTEDGMGKTEAEKEKIVESKIIPSLEMLHDMEKEGVLSGGFFGGQRSAAFVMSVEDEDTLDNTMTTLPCSDIFEIETIPLEPLKEAIARDKNLLKPALKRAKPKAK